MNATREITTVIDPVCGMSVDPARAAGSAEFQGATFHFCAVSCKSTFEAEPQKYVAAPESAGSCCGGGGCH